MAQYPMTPDTAFSTPFSAEERVSAFLRSVYGWMCGGLGHHGSRRVLRGLCRRLWSERWSERRSS